MVGKSVGNYVLRREIGRGAMGAVYLAENPHIGRWVAVKLLKDGCTLEGKVLQRFRDEARCIQGMDREHIVEISDYGHLPEGRSQEGPARRPRETSASASPRRWRIGLGLGRRAVGEGAQGPVGRPG